MGFLNKLFGNSGKQDLQKANLDAAQTTGAINLTRIYPRIKGFYDDENPDPSPNTGNPEITLSLDDSPVMKPLAKGIGICYMKDMGDRYELILNRDLSEELTIEVLHQTALKNMAIAVNDRTQVNGDPSDMMIVTNGGDFEATMLLADFLWDQIEPLFQDSICVAIPTNDLLFIAPKNNPEAREGLKNLVRQYFENSETKGLIVKNIYERVNGEWIFLESA